MARDAPAFLRLVYSDSKPAAPSSAPTGAAQESFLPSSDPSTLLFLAWSKISESELLDVFMLSKPKLAFDMRFVPRFDLGQLTRKRFFDLARQYDTQYVDLFGRMGVDNVRNALVNPALVSSFALNFLEQLRLPKGGPVVFFYDDDLIDDAYISALAKALPHSGGGWQVFCPSKGNEGERKRRSAEPNDHVGQATIAQIERRAIFISHATPEDNSFVSWLASKLTAAGYDVWCDIVNLGGGDGFWKDIEETIRERAAKVIFVQSKSVKGKAGARKEVYLALRVGDKNRRTRFVIPMRIDATPFDETFIELIDLQAIDCRRDWLVGLKSLLALLERDRVPRTTTFKAEQFAGLVSKIGRPSHSLVQRDESLVSNLLSVVEPPRKINFLSCAGLQSNQLSAVADRLTVPAFAYYAHIATTASLEQFSSAMADIGLRENVVRVRASLSWSDFLNGVSGDLPNWTRREARNSAFRLLNKAWTLHVEKQGVATGFLANGRPFWFFPDQHFPNNKVQFASHSGRLIKRQLVGYSGKRRVYWHFGVQARCLSVDQEFLFSLTPHVTFSADGKVLLPSKAQLHSLRRSFCRSWWNDRWRDLLQGFVSALQQDESHSLDLDVGSDMPTKVAGGFVQYRSASSLVEAEPLLQLPEEAIFDEEIEDEWDEEFEDDVLVEEVSEEPSLPESN